jgi:hypothetical protein
VTDITILIQLIELSPMADLVTRLNLFEKQLLRHESELSICLGLSARLDALERLFKSEQLYREGQEMIWGERPIEANSSCGFARLKESARFGHSGASLACGRIAAAGKICERNLASSTMVVVCATGMEFREILARP